MNLKRITLGGMLVVGILLINTFDGLAQRSNKSDIITDKVQLAKLRAAVEKSPDSPKVHQSYIKAMGIENPELEKQYKLWMNKCPKSAMVAYSIAKAYLNEENPKAKPYLLKTVAIDPKFTEAWGGLWVDAQRWGDLKASEDYLAKAVASDPSNPEYGFYYASSFMDTDEAKWRKMSVDFAKRFPNHERGAQALFWLGYASTKTSDKLKYFELLRESFQPEKFDWSSSGMISYFDVLLSENPQRAVILAQEMAKNEKEKKKEWPDRIVQAEIVSKTQMLLGQKNAAEALTLLKTLKLPRYSRFKTDLILLTAKANDLAGNTQAAYDSLIVKLAAAPSVILKTAIDGYGSKLGKNESKVNADIWLRLDAVSQIATPFVGLKRYLTPGVASLGDYKGKVVLLTYWFPGCGPCRGEFPHFENVVRKFKGQDLEYLGINVVSKQNDYVVPFIKGSDYSFTPLEDVQGRVKGNLDNRNAAPKNFLIDKDGRLIFSDFRTDADSEEDLELMISLILNRK